MLLKAFAEVTETFIKYITTTTYFAQEHQQN
jgi:hypothetical protein